MTSARTLYTQVEALALLAALALLWAGPGVRAGPLPGVPADPLPCERGCMASPLLFPSFQHISQLGSRSTSPWELVEDDQEIGREPTIIRQARCKNCSQPGELEAQPILVQVFVSKPSQLRPNTWCRCPHKVAVGCTCVPKRKSAAA